MTPQTLPALGIRPRKAHIYPLRIPRRRSVDAYSPDVIEHYEDLGQSALDAGFLYGYMSS